MAKKSPGARRIRYLAGVLMVAAAYGVAAKVGLHFSTLPGNITAVWPPAGVALVALLRWGLRLWPGLVIGSAVVDVSEGLPWLVVMTVVVANTGQAVIAAWWLRRIPSFDVGFRKFSDLGWLMAAGATGAVFAATVGVSGVHLAGLVAWSTVPMLWGIWWMSDTVAVLVLAPLGLAWTREFAMPRVSRAVETGLMLTSVLLVSMAVYWRPIAGLGVEPFTYALFPLLIWAAARTGVRGTTAAVLLGTSAAVVGTAAASGPFWHDTLPRSMVSLYAFLTAAAASAVALALVVSERAAARGQVRSRQRYLQTVIGASPIGIATLDANGRIRTLNPALKRLLGGRRQARRRSHFSDIIKGPEGDALQRAVEKAAAGAPKTVVEARIPRRPMGSAWVRMVTAPVDRDDGDDTSVIALVEDLTDRHRAAEADLLASARNRTIEELREQTAWKSRILDIASHEIKTPLTPLRIHLHLLEFGRFGKLNEGQFETVRRLRGEVDRLARTVDDYLQMSRIESGRFEIHPTRVDLSALLDDVADAYETSSESWQVEFVRHVERDLEADLDEERVREVLHNLLSNAFKFTPEGGRVELRAHNEADAVVIEVVDSGVGLRADQIERLFRPFAQVHDAVEAATQGSGLGLYISNAIVASHQGTLMCSSAGPGRGAMFRVRLPIQRHVPLPAADDLVRAEPRKADVHGDTSTMMQPAP